MGQPYNPLIVQDLQPVKTYFVFSVHTMSSAATFPQRRTKKPACCGQSCSRKTKPHRQLHMRGLWDPHVILMKGSAQTGYRFLSASFEEYQNLLFLLRDLSGTEMKTCSLGIAVEIRGMCALFSRTTDAPTWWGCLWVFPGFAKKKKLHEMIKRSRKFWLESAVQLSKLWSLNERKEPQLFMLSSRGWMTAKFSLPAASFISAQKEYNSEECCKGFSAGHHTQVASQNSQLLFLFWNSFLYCSFPLLSAIPSFFVTAVSAKI